MKQDDQHPVQFRVKHTGGRTFVLRGKKEAQDTGEAQAISNKFVAAFHKVLGERKEPGPPQDSALAEASIEANEGEAKPPVEKLVNDIAWHTAPRVAECRGR